jgi:hypothetical protein
MHDPRSRSPISTEARAALRRWKVDLTKRYVEFDRILHRDTTLDVVADLSLCGWADSEPSGPSNVSSPMRVSNMCGSASP